MHYYLKTCEFGPERYSTILRQAITIRIDGGTRELRIKKHRSQSQIEFHGYDQETLVISSD